MTRFPPAESRKERPCRAVSPALSYCCCVPAFVWSRRRLQARPRFAGAAGRAARQGDQAHLDEQDLPRHGARLLGLRPGPVRRQEAGLRHGLSGRRRLRQSQGPVPRADRLRQSHPQEGDAGDDRHLHQSGQRSRPSDNGQKPRSNRSFEYDTLSDQYARFLEKEILPEVGKKYKLRQDAAGRAICGISSGGICAFTVAWERPDLFSKVLSHVGSFTNIRGGDVYPGLIRKTRNASRSASSCRTARTIWTTSTATGRSPTSRWRRR